MAGFVFVKSERGTTVEVKQTEMAEDAYAGDLIVLETDRSTAKIMDAAGEFVHGVLLHDVDYSEEATAHYIPVKPEYYFKVATTASYQYDDSDDRYTVADIGAFTSGAMTVTCTSHAYGHVQLVGLPDGEDDDTTGNEVLVRFNPRCTDYNVRDLIPPGQGNVLEVTDDLSFVHATHNGVCLLVTGTDKTVTLAAGVVGMSCFVVNGALGYGDSGVMIDPPANEQIIGLGGTGANAKYIINTKATACPGDFIHLLCGSVTESNTEWSIIAARGIWAYES